MDFLVSEQRHTVTTIFYEIVKLSKREVDIGGYESAAPGSIVTIGPGNQLGKFRCQVGCSFSIVSVAMARADNFGVFSANQSRPGRQRVNVHR